MKIVPASFEIMMDDENKLRMIGNRARICYRSEMKDDETGFVRNHVIGRGHNSTIEMAAVSLIYTGMLNDKGSYKMLSDCKYIISDTFGEYDDHVDVLMTSTVRGWRELLLSNLDPYSNSFNLWVMKTNLLDILSEKYPDLFYDILKTDPEEKECCFKHFEELQIGNNIPSSVVEDSNDQECIDLYMRHKFQAVKILTNRAVTHEIVRHRPVSYLQESQRYCRYDLDKFGNEVTFIDPKTFFKEGSNEYADWLEAMEITEKIYLRLLETSSPQAARTVLPNSCKTEIIVYCNLREWCHFFAMRVDPAAEPSMREITIPLLEEFKKLYPGMFNNIRRSIGGE